MGGKVPSGQEHRGEGGKSYLGNAQIDEVTLIKVLPFAISVY